MSDYYVGAVDFKAILGDNNPRYFLALRRSEEGDLYFAKIDQVKDTDSITVNTVGPTSENFEDFEYGVDYFDGRLEADHSRPYENLYWDQYRWDDRNCYYYIDNNGELTVRINQVYEYDPSQIV